MSFTKGEEMGTDPYEKSAKRYDRYVEPSISVLRKIGMKMYPPNEGMYVLDVGCGTGTNLMLYHEAGCKSFGIDLSPSMVEVATKKLGDQAEIRLGDASKMEFPDATFDLVIGFLTLHEMPSQIRTPVLQEMERVMKRDGRILLIDFHPGPLRFPKGWWYKAVILFFEIMAGREHYSNYRDFLSRKGLPALLSTHNLSTVDKKIVSGGNVALLLLSAD
jgi:demethylmenaquinone methyltransferase/2-methoxy-6-polyprenyl-1,4-benzoquinol methylase